jgi:uncharacterized protein (DUF433 family)
MDWREYIESDPAVLGGRPVFKGSRLSVELMLDLMSEGWTTEDFRESYPTFTQERLRAALAFAADAVASVALEEVEAHELVNSATAISLT